MGTHDGDSYESLGHVVRKPDGLRPLFSVRFISIGFDDAPGSSVLGNGHVNLVKFGVALSSTSISSRASALTPRLISLTRQPSMAWG